MSDLKVLSKVHHALGTRIILQIFGTENDIILRESIKLIDHYEDIFTVNRKNSEIMAINQAAGKKKIKVSHASFELAKKAVLESQKNYGFNALIGPLVKSWRIGFKDAHIPNEKVIQQKLRLIDPQNVEIDDQTESIFLTIAGMELDLGGIAKGYIADRIRDLWHAYGIQAGIINLGGNILFVNSSPKRSDGQWLVGIQDPQKQRGENITFATTKPASVVTSGVNERFFKANGITYHHLLDPVTGYPLKTDLLSVTTFTKDSIQAELECKRLFFNPNLLDSWLDKKSGRYGAVLIYRNHQVKRVGI